MRFAIKCFRNNLRKPCRLLQSYQQLLYNNYHINFADCVLFLGIIAKNKGDRVDRHLKRKIWQFHIEIDSQID